MNTAIVPAHAQRVALSLHIILKLDYVGSQGSSDVKLQVMMVARFSVSEVLSMWYNSDLDLSEDESSCNEGEWSMPIEDQVL